MLMLTRKIGNVDQAKITITTPTGDKIEVCLLGVNGAKGVKVGIDAPKQYSVVRNELLGKSKNGGIQKPLE